MAHTPTSPIGDDRPFKILDRADVPEACKQRLFTLVQRAQQAAKSAGAELQGEFGRDAVAMIVGCNQFLRLYRGGEHPGRVELLVADEVKILLADAGFTLHDPEGQVFKMFGWVAVDPTEGDLDRLAEAVDAAFAGAAARGP